MQFLQASTRSYCISISPNTTADYDVNINHNNDWLYLKPKAGGGTLDVDSGVQMCYKDPHVENVFWTDQNQAKGQYIVQVTCANGYCNEEWTLNIYLDGNLYKTYKGKNNYQFDLAI